jgi:hypothetical protein
VGHAQFGKDDVLNFGAATESDAKAVGEQLQKIGFFKDRGASVAVVNNGDGMVLAFVVGEEGWDQPEALASFQAIAKLCAPAIGGLPIKLRFVTPQLQTRKEIVIE